jgi:hypoxanthine-guanine phosphoribosyltransferase
MGDSKIKDVLVQQERIKSEIKNLNKLFNKMDNKTKKAVHTLIENAAFMSVQLEDLQDHMNENGVISEYQNGENQWGTKKSPEAEVYNSMIKNHMLVMKQLTDLLPKSLPEPKDDGFEKFVDSK